MIAYIYNKQRLLAYFMSQEIKRKMSPIVY